MNKVATCVILVHRPTGLTIRFDEERSQGANRYVARKRLAERWESIRRATALRERQAIERSKRQGRGRNRAAKENILKEKRRRAEIKRSRRLSRHAIDE